MIFISYARSDDEPFVQRLHLDLRAAGVNIWWDRQAMESRGRTFLQEIRDAIGAADRVILVVGPAAVKSAYVQAEWELAAERCIPIVPILRIGTFELLPAPLAKLHCIDVRETRGHADALAELVRVLRADVPKLAPLIGVDALPRHFVPRPAELVRLSNFLLADVQRPTVIRSAPQTASLQGMAGIGKSVLGAAFARSCAVRHAFDDGVVWLRVGPGSDTLSLLRRLGELIEDRSLQQTTSLTATPLLLSAALRNKSFLIVLDDVWDMSEVEVVVNALGPKCRLLMTTRDGGLARALGADELALDSLDPSQGLLLLARWSDQPTEELPPEAALVAAECGCLPLALALIGAMVRGRPDRWPHALSRLRAADLQKIRQRFPNYPYPDLFRAIDVSLQALQPLDRAAYVDLAVFKEGTPIPFSAVSVLWQQRHGIDNADATDLVDRLVERSMLRQNDQGALILHALQSDFVRQAAGDLTQLHKSLLDAYRRQCSNRWSAGPNDGYFFEWLPYHLAAVGDREQLDLLLTEYAWLDAKLLATNAHAMVRDFTLTPSASARPLHRALELSAHVLAEDPEQLPSQLIGRLLSGGDAMIQKLIDDAERAPRTVWLRPLSACLGPTEGALIATLAGHTDRVNAVAVTADGRYAVSGSLDKTVRLWDLGAHRLLHTFAGHTDCVNTVAITPDGRFAASGAGWPRPFKLEIQIEAFLEGVDLRPSRDTSIKLWDVNERRAVRELHIHTAAVRSLIFIDGGKGLVSGGDDNRVHLWAFDDDGVPLAEGKHRIVFLAERRSAGQIFAFSEFHFTVFDLKRFGSVDGTLGVWDNVLGMDAEQLKVLLQYTSFEGDHFSLKVWNLAHPDPNSEKIDRVDTCSAYLKTACFVNDRVIAAGHRDGRIRVLAPEAGMSRTLRGHRGEVTCLAGFDDGRRLVSGSHDGTLMLWDLTVTHPSESERDEASELREVYAVALSCDGRNAVSASSDRVVDVWSVDTRKRVASHAAPVTPFDLKLVGDGRVAILGCADGSLVFLDVTDGAVLHQVGSHKDAIIAVAIDATDSVAATASRDKSVKIFDLTRRIEIAALSGHDASVAAVALLPGGARAVSVDTAGRCIVWNLASGRAEGDLTGDEEPAESDTPGVKWELSGPEMRAVRRPSAVAALGDDRHVAVASARAPIVIWDVVSRQPVATLEDPRCGRVKELKLSHDRRLLLSTDDRQSCGVWEVRTRRPLAFFTFDASTLVCDVGGVTPTVIAGLSGGPYNVAFLRLERPR